jgi:hypothetical protein
VNRRSKPALSKGRSRACGVAVRHRHNRKAKGSALAWVKEPALKGFGSPVNPPGTGAMRLSRSPQKCWYNIGILDPCYPALGVSQRLILINPISTKGNAYADTSRHSL